MKRNWYWRLEIHPFSTSMIMGGRVSQKSWDFVIDSLEKSSKKTHVLVFLQKPQRKLRGPWPRMFGKYIYIYIFIYIYIIDLKINGLDEKKLPQNVLKFGSCDLFHWTSRRGLGPSPPPPHQPKGFNGVASTTHLSSGRSSSWRLQVGELLVLATRILRRFFHLLLMGFI